VKVLVGFWGHLVAAKPGTPIDTPTWLTDSGLGQATDQQTLAGGWQVFHTAGQGENLAAGARHAAAATAAPVIAAFVLDSDCAILVAAGTDGQVVQAVLNAEIAVDSYEMPEPELEPDEVADQLATWARGQGLHPDIEQLRQTLTDTAVIVEDAFTDLLAGLGVANNHAA
jgi:hypothetical protein